MLSRVYEQEQITRNNPNTTIWTNIINPREYDYDSGAAQLGVIKLFYQATDEKVAFFDFWAILQKIKKNESFLNFR